MVRGSARDEAVWVHCQDKALSPLKTMHRYHAVMVQLETECAPIPTCAVPDSDIAALRTCTVPIRNQYVVMVGPEMALVPMLHCAALNMDTVVPPLNIVTTILFCIVVTVLLAMEIVKTPTSVAPSMDIVGPRMCIVPIQTHLVAMAWSGMVFVPIQRCAVLYMDIAVRHPIIVPIYQRQAPYPVHHRRLTRQVRMQTQLTCNTCDEQASFVTSNHY